MKSIKKLKYFGLALITAMAFAPGALAQEDQWDINGDVDNDGQVGPTDIMTVDANGTVGRDTTLRPALAAIGTAVTNLGNQIAGLEANQTLLFDLTRTNQKEARRGIAAAVAMADAPVPSAPGRTSYATNGAVYRGEVAVSFSLMHRFNLDTPVAFTAGVSHSGGKDTAFRAGIAGEF